MTIYSSTVMSGVVCMWVYGARQMYTHGDEMTTHDHSQAVGGAFVPVEGGEHNSLGSALAILAICSITVRYCVQGIYGI